MKDEKLKRVDRIDRETWDKFRSVVYIYLKGRNPGVVWRKPPTLKMKVRKKRKGP
jgi:hypothetical protein